MKVFVVMIAFWLSPALAWTYKTQENPMGGVVKTAVVLSSNDIVFDSPYGGVQKGALRLRVHPRYGRDVMLEIQRGQFLCGVDGCSVLVRFDDKKAERFSATGPADHSSTTLFIDNHGRFVTALRASKRVRIEAIFYNQGTRVFDFEVAGLQWDGQKPLGRAPGQK